MPSRVARACSTDHGIRLALRYHTKPANSRPKTQIARVTRSSPRPAARIAVNSLLRWSCPSAYSSDNSTEICSTTGTLPGTSTR